MHFQMVTTYPSIPLALEHLVLVALLAQMVQVFQGYPAV